MTFTTTPQPGSEAPLEDALHALAIGVAAGRGADELFDIALVCILERMRADGAAIFAVDGAGELQWKASVGSAPVRAGGDDLSGLRAFAAHSAPLATDDVRADPTLQGVAEALASAGVRSLALIPLALGPRVLGQLMICHHRAHVMSADELQAARGVAALVSLAMNQQEDRARDQRFRQLVETLGVAVYTTDADGVLTFFNDEACVLWGRRPQLGVDRWCGALRLFAPDGSPMQLEHSPMAIALRERRHLRGMEAIAERPDGTRVTFMPYPSPVVDAAGHLIGGVNVLVDVTRLRDAETALTEKEATLVAALADKEQLLGAQREAIRLYELAQAQLASLIEACGALISTRSPQQALRAVLQVAVGFLRADAFAIWRRRGDGRWETVASHGLQDPYVQPSLVHEQLHAGELKGALVIEDIAVQGPPGSTRDWHAGEGIRSCFMAPLSIAGETQGSLAFFYREPHQFSELEVRVGSALANLASASLTLSGLFEENENARTELQQANGALQELALHLSMANAAKDEFLSLVSHELKTPLTTIWGNAAVLFRTNGEVDQESARAALADIVSESERLHRIIENLLLLARAEKGQGPEAEPLLVSRVVERVVERHRQRTANRVFRTRVLNDPRPVVFSEAFLEQVVENLVSNAEKYSPVSAPIEIELERSAGEVRLRVLDRGIGIQPDDLERLFDPFFRSASVKTRSEGLGIGLAVCKRLVQAQGGRIWAKTRPDGGSEFGFALPIIEDDDLSAVAGAPASSSEPPSGRADESPSQTQNDRQMTRARRAR
ncbi:MAG TPA: ATP-binding protein [Dehalococcoidia bacterium]|nr:ATP-binding protein [Dehalococcoidia bacterium]